MRRLFYIVIGVLAVIITAGIIKFNILAGLDNYDVDGNRISTGRTLNR